MSKKGVYVFSKALQRSIILLRWVGLLEYKQFPVLLTPIKVVRVREGDAKKETPWFLVKIRVKSSSNPDQKWLLFKRRGNRIYFSDTQENWTHVFEYKGSIISRVNKKLAVTYGFPYHQSKIG